MTAAEELEVKLDSLHRNRDREREAALVHPRKAEAESLRVEVVALKNGGKPYAEKMAERDALVALIMAEVNETGREIKTVRHKLRMARQAEMMELYSKLPTDEIRFKRAQFMNEARAAKAHANAIRRVIDSRDTENEARQLVEAMSAAQRTALIAELLRAEEEG
jgi:hypothetical protein